MSTQTHPETVLVPAARTGAKCYHLLADDGIHPICGGDARSGREWRQVPSDHPSLTFRRECKQCRRWAES